MYKIRTIDQFKVHRFLKEHFALENFLISPLSRSALMLEDQDGEKIAFAFLDGAVHEIAIPPPPDPEKINLFFKEFRALDPKPILTDFDSVAHWWLNHTNPLTYQQALGLPDDLYRHFLSHHLIDEESVVKLARKGLVIEDEYRDIRLWYHNGNSASRWLGPLGIDGTGYIYGLTLNYGKLDAVCFRFYLLDDYYRYMSRIPD